MPLEPDVLAGLRALAQQVSKATGHDVQVKVPPVAEFIMLEIDGTVETGPEPLNQMGAHNIDLRLDALKSGALVIFTDDEGLPRVVSPEELT